MIVTFHSFKSFTKPGVTALIKAAGKLDSSFYCFSLGKSLQHFWRKSFFSSLLTRSTFLHVFTRISLLSPAAIWYHKTLQMITKEPCIKMKRTFRVQHDAVKFHPFRTMWVDLRLSIRRDEILCCVWLVISMDETISLDEGNISYRKCFAFHSDNESIIIICWFIASFNHVLFTPRRLWLKLKMPFGHINAFLYVLRLCEVSNESWRKAAERVEAFHA